MSTWIYLDTSAVAKLFVAEPESADLRTWFAEQRGGVHLVSSALLGVELVRLLRLVNPDAISAAQEFLSTDVDIVDIRASVLADAAAVSPPRLRSLDAIHLATALDLIDSIDILLTYDKRFIEACHAAGIPVASPGVA